MYQAELKINGELIDAKDLPNEVLDKLIKYFERLK